MMNPKKKSDGCHKSIDYEDNKKVYGVEDEDKNIGERQAEEIDNDDSNKNSTSSVNRGRQDDQNNRLGVLDLDKNAELIGLQPDLDWNRIIQKAKSVPNKPLDRIRYNLGLLQHRFGPDRAKTLIEGNGFLLMHPESVITVGEEWTDYLGQKRLGGTLKQRKNYKSKQRQLRKDPKHRL